MIRQYLSELMWKLHRSLCPHESALPNIHEHKYRLICSECGWMSSGIRIGQ